MRPAMSELAAWDRFAAVIVAGFNPRWLAELPAGLIAAARCSPLGQRMLAARLARGPAPLAMGVPSTESLAVLQRHSWLGLPAAELDARLADIGAVSLLPGIRARVERHAVIAIRTGLGSDRHDFVLDYGDPWPGGAPRRVQERAASELEATLQDPAGLLRLARRRGLQELRGALDAADALALETLSLLTGPDAAGVPATAWLPGRVAIDIATCDRTARPSTQTHTVVPLAEKPGHDNRD